MEIPTKECYKCNEEKPLYEYNQNRRARDGLCTRCKECTKKYKNQSEVEKLRGYFSSGFNGRWHC